SEPKKDNAFAKVDSKKRLPCLGLREHAVKVGPCRKVLRVQSTRWVLRRPSELAAIRGKVHRTETGPIHIRLIYRNTLSRMTRPPTPINLETPGSQFVETRRFAGGHKVSRSLEFANASEL